MRGIEHRFVAELSLFVGLKSAMDQIGPSPFEAKSCA